MLLSKQFSVECLNLFFVAQTFIQNCLFSDILQIYGICWSMCYRKLKFLIRRKKIVTTLRII